MRRLSENARKRESEKAIRREEDLPGVLGTSLQNRVLRSGMGRLDSRRPDLQAVSRFRSIAFSLARLLACSPSRLLAYSPPSNTATSGSWSDNRCGDVSSGIAGG